MARITQQSHINNKLGETYYEGERLSNELTPLFVLHKRNCFASEFFVSLWLKANVACHIVAGSQCLLPTPMSVITAWGKGK